MEDKDQKAEQAGDCPAAAAGKNKLVTTLDIIPAGDHAAASIKTSVKHPLPDGVTSKMLYRDILKIGWPALVELMLMQLTSMADLMMVGKLGPWAITAVGLTTQPKFLLSTVFMSLNIGTMAMVGRYRGAGNKEKAELVLRQAFILNLLLGFVFAIIGVLFSEQLVAFMGATEDRVLIAGTQYLKIQMIGMFTVSITATISSALRGVGNSKTAMIYNTTANVVNVFFNYLLIYGKFGFPKMGVAGASLATVIGQGVACIMAISVIRKNDQYIKLEFPKGSIKPDKECLNSIFQIGVPALVEQTAMRIGVIIFSKTIASLGTIPYATHQVCMNIQALTFMNGQAFSTSATALVSQSLGKKRPDMAMHYSKRTQLTGMYVAIGIAIFIFTCNKFVLGLYTDDVAIIVTGGALLQMIALIQPFQASQFILAGALRGAGDTRYTAMVTTFTVMLLRPALALLLVNYFHLGLTGAWYALVADQLLRSLLISLRYVSGKWTTSFSHDAGK
ncbi:MAG: MATE family efflux transporter [Clostridiaceae bacterium]|nr:MATE family efflux transporter [Clostridiaceae bacterium]